VVATGPPLSFAFLRISFAPWHLGALALNSAEKYGPGETG
jgi:hypothetical protein